MAHVQGNDDGAGFSVEGTSQNNAGIIGSSTGGKGVIATSETDIGAFAWSKNSVGLTAYSGPKPPPIVGERFPLSPPTNAGVYGYSLGNNAAGVVGENVSVGSYGVLGTNRNGTGVFGTSNNGEGVHGETNSTTFAAVSGIELNPSSNIAAVYGEQRGGGPGVYGIAKGNGAGVFGGSANGEGVHGETNSTTFAAVAGIELNRAATLPPYMASRGVMVRGYMASPRATALESSALLPVGMPATSKVTSSQPALLQRTTMSARAATAPKIST